MQLWLASPGLQLVRARALDYRGVVDRHAHLRERGVPLCDRVEAALSNTWLGLPVPRYDAAWAALHQVRGLFCELLSCDELLALVLPDMSADLSYLDQPAQRPMRTELDAISAGLHRLLGAENHAAERALRSRLQAASRTIADARESLWLKVNMRRSRLALMGVLLGLVLVIAVAALPTVVSDRSHAFFLGVALSGAGGGLISSLFSPEPLNAKAAVFYISRRLLYLRPLVGAAAALATVFAVQAGVLSVVGVGTDSAPVGFLVVAFAAGFSERIVINRVVQPLTGRTPAGTATDGTHPGASTT